MMSVPEGSEERNLMNVLASHLEEAKMSNSEQGKATLMYRTILFLQIATVRLKPSGNDFAMIRDDQSSCH